MVRCRNSKAMSRFRNPVTLPPFPSPPPPAVPAVYLVDRVIPMLPRLLCEELCRCGLGSCTASQLHCRCFADSLALLSQHRCYVCSAVLLVSVPSHVFCSPTQQGLYERNECSASFSHSPKQTAHACTCAVPRCAMLCLLQPEPRGRPPGLQCGVGHECWRRNPVRLREGVGRSHFVLCRAVLCRAMMPCVAACTASLAPALPATRSTAPSRTTTTTITTTTTTTSTSHHLLTAAGRPGLVAA
jgi:hypothetical protein